MTRTTLALLAALTLGCSPAPRYDLVLHGGRVMDPATSLDSVLDVGIRDGRIAAIAAGPLAADTVIDVAGLVVAPGFIDLHAHGQTEADMRIQARDGVTTALEMEIGVYPVAPWYEERTGKSPLNFGATVGHLAARFALLSGYEIGHMAVNRAGVASLGPNPAGANAAATDAQVEALGGNLRRGLSEGALGIGFGINYTPAASPAEIDEMFKIAAEQRVPAFVHTRAFGLGPIREAVETAARTGASLHVVHVGSSAGDDLPAALALIDSVRAAGQDVTTEVYPYTAASTALESAMFNPGWQANLKLDYGDIAWAATGERLTRETFERYRRQGGWVIIYLMKEPNVTAAIGHPGVMIASDGIPFVNGTGHPRGAGTFARVLGRYVREQQALGLMDALAKMTILPARRLESYVPALRSKGRLAVGADADVTVFDPATVIDRATFEQPTEPSAGIPFVLVGGTFVVRNGETVTGAFPGRPIRTDRTP